MIYFGFIEKLPLCCSFANVGSAALSRFSLRLVWFERLKVEMTQKRDGWAGEWLFISTSSQITLSPDSCFKVTVLPALGKSVWLYVLQSR